MTHRSHIKMNVTIKRTAHLYLLLCLRFNCQGNRCFCQFSFIPPRFMRSSARLELNPHLSSVSPALCVNGFDRAELSQNLRCHFQSRGSRCSSDGRCGRPDSVKMFPLWRAVIM